MRTHGAEGVAPAWLGAREGLRLLSRAGVYVAAGALRQQEIRAAIAFRPDPASVDAFDVDDGLTRDEARLYRRWIPPGSRVLLAGCGTGRRVMGLLELGHDVTGVDRSAGAVAAVQAHAVRRGFVCTVRCRTIESPNTDGVFDVVVFSAGCFSSIFSADARRATLARMAAALRPGGRIIVHHMRDPAPAAASRILLRAAGWLAGTDWRPERGDTFSLRHRGIPGMLFQRTFGDGELALEAGTAGLRVLMEHRERHRATTVLDRWIDVTDTGVPAVDLARPGRVIGRAARLDRACVTLIRGIESAAAGSIGDRTLEEALSTQFAGFAVSADDVDRGLTPFERMVYGEHLAPGSRVLLIGCGAGRDLIGLAALGYAVSGLECSPDLVATARAHLARRGLSCTITCATAQRAPIEGPFEAIVMAPACYSYIRGRDTRIRTLTTLRNALAPDGRLIVHVITSVTPPRFASAVLRTAAWVSRGGWRPEPGDVYSLSPTTRRPTFFHSFAEGDVTAEATAAGFGEVASYRSASRSDCLVLRAEE